MIADAGHPLRARDEIRPEDLLSYPWILPPATTYMVGRLQRLLRAAGLPSPAPSIETDVIPLKFALMRDSDYLSYHAAAYLAGFDPNFIKPLDDPNTRTVRQAGLINRGGIEFSPAAKALIVILGRRRDGLRT